MLYVFKWTVAIAPLVGAFLLEEAFLEWLTLILGVACEFTVAWKAWFFYSHKGKLTRAMFYDALAESVTFAIAIIFAIGRIKNVVQGWPPHFICALNMAIYMSNTMTTFNMALVVRKLREEGRQEQEMLDSREIIPDPPMNS